MRRLRALVQGLPSRSATHRSIVGEAAEWGVAEELSATAVEVSHATLRVLLKAFSKAGSSGPQPLQIPRPGDRSERSQPTREDFRRTLLGR